MDPSARAAVKPGRMAKAAVAVGVENAMRSSTSKAQLGARERADIVLEADEHVPLVVRVGAVVVPESRGRRT